MFSDALVTVGAVARYPVPAGVLAAKVVEVLTLTPFTALCRGPVERTNLPFPRLSIVGLVTGSGAIAGMKV